MKKLKFLLPLLLLFIVTNVDAKTTKNGVSIDKDTETYTTLSCSYANDLIVINDTADHYEVNRYQNGKELESSLPFSSIPSKKQLKDYKFIRSDDSWDCPKHIILDGDKIIDTTNDDNDHRPNTGYLIEDLDKKSSKCIGACLKQATSNSKYTCNYTHGKNKITVKGEGNKCTITYPDGKEKNETNGVCGQIDSSCPDLFYDTKSKELLWATYDYEEYFVNADHYDSDMYNFLCKKNKNIQYFCKDGNCHYPSNKKINCKAISSIITGTSVCNDKGMKNAFRFIGYLFLIVKIVIPLLLTIMGVVDYSKAVIAGKQEEIKKATTALITRIACGLIIFLLPTILNFVFNLIKPYRTDASQFETCSKCLFNPTSCK